MKRSTYLLSGLATTLTLSGCVGYSLSGSTPAGIDSVTLAPIINKTGEPAIELRMTHSMRSRVQFDGRLKLENNAGQADGTIEIWLTNYKLTPIAYREDLDNTAELYRLRITAESELRSNTTGKVISTSKTYGEATFEFVADLTTSKRDALPRATDELARFILDDLIEQWK